jgi:hypothetical protein
MQGGRILAFVFLCVPIRAASLTVPFSVQASFPSFAVGANLTTGTWTITGTGTWVLDASTGSTNQTANLVINFPGLGLQVPVTFVATGPFVFARENATNRVGILAETQGTVAISLGGIPVTINLAAISSIVPIVNSQFPPSPTTPPSPLTLPALPNGFRALPAGTVPQLTELGSSGTIMAAVTVKVPLIAAQDFRGTGAIKIVSSNARCPAGATDPLSVFTGTWTFGMDGQSSHGTTFAGAGQFTAAIDSLTNPESGIMSVTQSSSIPVRSEMDTGTYQVLPDCSGGTMTFNISNEPIAFDFWFDNTFTEIRFVSTTSGTALRGSAARF